MTKVHVDTGNSSKHTLALFRGMTDEYKNVTEPISPALPSPTSVILGGRTNFNTNTFCLDFDKTKWLKSKIIDIDRRGTMSIVFSINDRDYHMWKCKIFFQKKCKINNKFLYINITNYYFLRVLFKGILFLQFKILRLYIMGEPGLPEDKAQAQLGVEMFSQFGGKKRKPSKKHAKKAGKKTGKKAGKKVVKKSKKKVVGKKTRKSVGKKKLGKRKTMGKRKMVMDGGDGMYDYLMTGSWGHSDNASAAARTPVPPPPPPPPLTAAESAALAATKLATAEDEMEAVLKKDEVLAKIIEYANEEDDFDVQPKGVDTLSREDKNLYLRLVELLAFEDRANIKLEDELAKIEQVGIAAKNAGHSSAWEAAAKRMAKAKWEEIEAKEAIAEAAKTRKGMSMSSGVEKSIEIAKRKR